MLKIKLKKLEPGAKLPRMMSANAAGYDLFASNSEPVEVKAGTVELIPTGIAISLPPGFEAQVRPRSGLALKNLVAPLNSPGTIDADYRGKVKVILFNFGKTPFFVEPGMRIAQMIISKHERAAFEVVEELDDTHRGSGGFGHTDK